MLKLKFYYKIDNQIIVVKLINPTPSLCAFTNEWENECAKMNEIIKYKCSDDKT
jgi:hypothetical protein